MAEQSNRGEIDDVYFIFTFPVIMALRHSSYAVSSEIYEQKLVMECERQCPYYYFPICATNGSESKMFVNICEMFAYNCDVEKSKQSNREPDECDQ